MDVFCLCLLAFAAGFVDSIAGGGGLIQLPALFIFLPPALAQSPPLVFGTNKLSSICGTGMAVFQYARRIRIHWQSTLPAGAAAFLFSFLGAYTTSVIDKQIMKPLILVLFILVTGYTFIHKDWGKVHAPKLTSQQELSYGLMIGAGIGFYDGFFGPGTGSFLLFLFVGLFGFDFLTATASAKVINFATNLSAVSYFAATRNILYFYALPMALCNILGATLGSRLAILKGNAFVRLLFMTLVSVMILRYAYELIVR